MIAALVEAGQSGLSTEGITIVLVGSGLAALQGLVLFVLSDLRGRIMRLENGRMREGD